MPDSVGASTAKNHAWEFQFISKMAETMKTLTARVNIHVRTKWELPWRKRVGLEGVFILYFSGISDPQCTHCDYVMLCYDMGKVSEAHCGFTLK